MGFVKNHPHPSLLPEGEGVNQTSFLSWGERARVRA